MGSARFELTKVTPKCGAEVHGIDLSQPLDDAQIQTLQEALAAHCVLFFRDQRMTPEQQKAFGRRFGELHLHPAWPRLLEGHPEIMEIYADKDTKRIAGEDWHTDVSCDPEPPLGTILYMLEVPSEGGDTLFSSMVAASAALPLRASALPRTPVQTESMVGTLCVMHCCTPMRIKGSARSSSSFSIHI